MAKTLEADLASAFLPKQSQYDRHPYLAVPPPLHGCRPTPSVRDTCTSIITSFLAFLLFLCALGVLLWPSNPEVKIIDIELNHVNISNKAGGALDSPTISMDLKIQVRNRDFVAREYNTILLLIEYEGKWQGNTTAKGVAVDARSTASLELDAQFSLSQVMEKIVVRNGHILKEAISVGIAIHIGGNFQFLYFNVPVNGSTSCAITIDTEHQALTCQECCTKKPWRGTPAGGD